MTLNQNLSKQCQMFLDLGTAQEGTSSELQMVFQFDFLYLAGGGPFDIIIEHRTLSIHR